jgi:hypothetical protein
MKSIARRLAAIERRLAPSSAEPLVIVVSGGLPGVGPKHANVAGVELECGPSESFANFEARVVAAAKAARYDVVVIGGLPNPKHLIEKKERPEAK